MDISIIKEFFVDYQFVTLLYTTFIFFGIAIITWIMYISLSKRDLFSLDIADYLPKTKIRLHIVSYMFKYLVLFPLYSFIWFLIFAFSLALLSKEYKIIDILFFSIVLVSVIRVASYIHEKFSEDLAKLLPLTLITILLLNPSSISFEAIKQTSAVFRPELPHMVKYLLFTILLEWILRASFAIIMHIKKTHFAKKVVASSTMQIKE